MRARADLTTTRTTLSAHSPRNGGPCTTSGIEYMSSHLRAKCAMLDAHAFPTSSYHLARRIKIIGARTLPRVRAREPHQKCQQNRRKRNYETNKAGAFHTVRCAQHSLPMTRLRSCAALCVGAHNTRYVRHLLQLVPPFHARSAPVCGAHTPSLTIGA